MAATMAGTKAPEASLPHWQIREARIEADPPHGVEADGEELGKTPVQVAVVPSALQVIVPRGQEPG
jgi:diacylglycerol kinase family enzyme